MACLVVGLLLYALGRPPAVTVRSDNPAPEQVPPASTPGSLQHVLAPRVADGDPRETVAGADTDRLALRALESTHGDLFDRLALPADKQFAFQKLLLQKQFGIGLESSGSDQERIERRLRALLSNEEHTVYREYQATLGAHVLVNTFKNALHESGMKLDPETERRLIEALHKESLSPDNPEPVASYCRAAQTILPADQMKIFSNVADFRKGLLREAADLVRQNSSD